MYLWYRTNRNHSTNADYVSSFSISVQFNVGSKPRKVLYSSIRCNVGTYRHLMPRQNSNWFLMVLKENCMIIYSKVLQNIRSFKKCEIYGSYRNRTVFSVRSNCKIDRKVNIRKKYVVMDRELMNRRKMRQDKKLIQQKRWYEKNEVSYNEDLFLMQCHLI